MTPCTASFELLEGSSIVELLLLLLVLNPDILTDSANGHWNNVTNDRRMIANEVFILAMI
jgi:hypothetical protein